MSSVQEITTCPQCGRESLHTDLNIRTFNERALCLACGQGYQNTFNPQTRSYDSQEYGGFGVIIVAEEQGTSISPFDAAMTEAEAMGHLIDIEAKGRNVIALTIFQDGALKFLRGSAQDVEIPQEADEYEFLTEM